MSNRVPTNVITGFLGVGKTTAILNLLSNKPAHEKWAVLVNEFGEIGIDGAILSDKDAIVKEVPGGCMCCTAGVPMSVGITALLRQHPDRLIIEPTGLGHPKEIIAVLESEQYQDYIELKAPIALVDPRHLSSERHLDNDNFIQQLSCADVVIGNKVDQLTSKDIDVFNDWLVNQTPAKIFHKLVKQGDIPLEVLDLSKRSHSHTHHDHDHDHDHDHEHHHHHSDVQSLLEPKFELSPTQLYLRKENVGQGFFSCGWIFGAEVVFDFDDLFSVCSDLTAERIKAVVNTTKGCYSFNVANGVVSVNEISLEGYESKFEVIDSQLMPWDELESVLIKVSNL